MTLVPWRYALCDVDGLELGDLIAYERELTLGVSTVGTATCRIRQEDPLYTAVDVPTAPANIANYLKVFDATGTLRFFGPIISADESGDGTEGKLKLTAADMAYNMATSYMIDPALQPQADGLGIVYTGEAVDDLIFDQLELAPNAAVFCFPNAGTSSGGFPSVNVTYQWKPLLEALNELGALLGSYEWAIRYTGGPPPVSLLDLLTAVGGASDVELGYGTAPSNVASYTRTRTIEQQTNSIIAIGNGSTLLSAVGVNTDSITAYKVVRDAVISYPEITTSALLDLLAQQHALYRGFAREIITLTPTVEGAPVYGQDYVVGDTMAATVVQYGRTRVDGTARLWSVTIRPNDVGGEVPTFTLQPAA